MEKTGYSIIGQGRIDEILKRCLGYSIQHFDYYKLGEQVAFSGVGNIDIDIDDEDLGDMEFDISDEDVNENEAVTSSDSSIDLGNGLRNLIMQQSDNIGNPPQNSEIDIDLDFDIDEDDLGDL